MVAEVLYWSSTSKHLVNCNLLAGSLGLSSLSGKQRCIVRGPRTCQLQSTYCVMFTRQGQNETMKQVLRSNRYFEVKMKL